MNDQQFVGNHFHAVTVNCRCQFCSHFDSLHFNRVKPKLVALCVRFVFLHLTAMKCSSLPAISKFSSPLVAVTLPVRSLYRWLTNWLNICVFFSSFFFTKWLFAFVFIHYNWLYCVFAPASVSVALRNVNSVFCILWRAAVGRGPLIYV